MALDTLEGILSRVNYHKPDRFDPAGRNFLIADVVAGDRLERIKGNMDFPVLDQSYRFWGEVQEERDKRWGDRYFRFTFFEALIDDSDVGVAEYLVRAKIPGLGRARAYALVNHFGADTLAVLRTDAARATEVRGITRAVADAVAAHFDEGLAFDPAAYAKLIDMFAGYKFPRKLVNLLLRDFASDAPAMVLWNPYILLAYPYMGWMGVDRFAIAAAGYDPDGLERHGAAIIEALTQLSKRGHTYGIRGEIDATAASLIGRRPSPSSWAAGLAAGEVVRVDGPGNGGHGEHGGNGTVQFALPGPAAQVSDGVGGRALDDGDGALAGWVEPDDLSDPDARYALPDLAHAEATIAARLALLARTARPLPFRLNTAGLADDQVAAVQHYEDHGVSILTGPPGTGKSYVLAKIISSIQDAGMAGIRVVAPTGRAAKRDAELLASHGVVGVESTTIHRALGPRPSDAPGGASRDTAKVGRGREAFGFQRCEGDPLPYQYIFVDELSMVDALLMASLVRAIAPGSRVLFVGDHNQLPSVMPGSVLRDMIDAGVPTATLADIKRSDGGGRVVRACHAIIRGEVPRPADVAELPTENWVHIEVGDPREIARTIVALHAEPTKSFPDRLWDMQVISAQKGRLPFGCDALNRALSELLNPAGTSAGVDARSIGADPRGANPVAGTATRGVGGGTPPAPLGGRRTGANGHGAGNELAIWGGDHDHTDGDGANPRGRHGRGDGDGDRADRAGVGSGRDGQGQIEGLGSGPPFRVGDKVCRVKNGPADAMVEAKDEDHVDWRWAGRPWKFAETYLVNGDLGVVMDIVEGERWSHAVVAFRDPNRLVRLPMAEHHLILAYALTVHRMQGSSCKYVIVPVSELFYYDRETGQGLWNRELFYTLISRTEQLLVTVGPFAAIPKAIGRKTVGRRRTMLRNLIDEKFSNRKICNA